jgi:hypothetical protein
MISLYDHQKKAIEKLKPGSILVGGVGSGKTLTSLVYFYEKICGGITLQKGDDTYSPMRLKKDLYVITTARKRDTLDWVKEAANIPLIIKKVDSWNRIKNYTSIKDAFFIFDEQRVIGSGVWVKSFINIAKNNQWILLTATPADTWMDLIPVFIANGFYKNRTEFIRRHVVYSRFTKFPKVERYLQITKLIELKNQITVDMHFTRKTISHEKRIVCNFDKEKQRRVMYDRWDIYDNAPIRDISKLCYLLRRVSNSDPDRLVKLKEIFEEHNKIVLFYNFNYELSALRKFAKKNGISYSEWNGHKHEPIPNTDSWLYLVQYIAGSEGWNCIETDTVVFFSQNYSYRIMIQAAGRIDRLNTPFVDLYYYTLTSNSEIDQAIGKALRQKRKFNENRFTSL